MSYYNKKFTTKRKEDPFRNWQHLKFQTNGLKSWTGHFVYPTYREALKDLFKAIDSSLTEGATVDTSRVKNVVFKTKYPQVNPINVFPVVKQELLKKNPNFGFDVTQDFKIKNNKIFIVKIKDASSFGLTNLPPGVPPRLYIKMVRPRDGKEPMYLSWHGCQDDVTGEFAPPPHVPLPGTVNFTRRKE